MFHTETLLHTLRQVSIHVSYSHSHNTLLHTKNRSVSTFHTATPTTLSSTQRTGQCPRFLQPLLQHSPPHKEQVSVHVSYNLIPHTHIHTHTHTHMKNRWLFMFHTKILNAHVSYTDVYVIPYFPPNTKVSVHVSNTTPHTPRSVFIFHTHTLLLTH